MAGWFGVSSNTLATVVSAILAFGGAWVGMRLGHQPGGIIGILAGLATFKFAVGPYLLAPVIIHGRRFPIGRWEPYDALKHRLAANDLRWGEDQSAILRELGFDALATLGTSSVNAPALVHLFHHRVEQVIGLVFTTSMSRSVVFRSERENERPRVTIAHYGKIISEGDAPFEIIERFHEIDPRLVWRAHIQLVATDRATGKPYRPAPSHVPIDPLAFMCAHQDRHHRWNIARGHFRDAGGGTTSMTWRGAFLRTWIMVPHQQRRHQRKARERTRRRLQELGIVAL